MLVDTLQALPSQAGKDPLKMDLSEAVVACRTAGVLTERTADLCSVIRSYRNLIHPGRAVRLAESLPNQSTAAVAIALVDMIADEVAKKRRAVVGLTAEQVLSKIVRDENVGVILKHLLEEVSSSEKRRLLLDLIPPEHERANQDFSGDEDRLCAAFRSTLDSADEVLRRQVAQRAVSVIREADGDYVERYLRAFFLSGDIGLLADKDRQIVVAKLLGVPPSKQELSKSALTLWKGIGPYLQAENVAQWVNAHIRTIVFGKDKQSIAISRQIFISEASEMTGEREARVVARIAAWKQQYRDSKEVVEQIAEIMVEVDEFRDIPF